MGSEQCGQTRVVLEIAMASFPETAKPVCSIGIPAVWSILLNPSAYLPRVVPNTVRTRQ